MTQVIKKGDRVLIQTGSSYSPDGEVTGVIIEDSPSETMVLLDPKYQGVMWGFIVNESARVDDSIRLKYKGQRCGHTWPNIEPNGHDDHIKRILPKTSQRRLP